MNEEIIKSILKTINNISKIENYSIKEKNIINDGYFNYIKLVYNIINKCLKEFESDINIVDRIYKIDSIYDKWKICFIFKENNLNKIYLTIKDNDNIEILINIDTTEISFNFIYTDDKYLFVKFNKQKRINDVILCNKDIRKLTSQHSQNVPQQYEAKKLNLVVSEKSCDFLETIKKKKTVLNNLSDIIDDVNKQNIQEGYQFLEKFKSCINEIEKYFMQ